jgi:uncharacterized protein YuzE
MDKMEMEMEWLQNGNRMEMIEIGMETVWKWHERGNVMGIEWE